MKLKIDNVDMGIAINCLNQMRPRYADDVQKEIEDTLWSLIEIYDHMKPGRRRKIRITSAEHRLIVHCLIDWRNYFLSAGEEGKASGVNDTLIAFME